MAAVIFNGLKNRGRSILSIQKWVVQDLSRGDHKLTTSTHKVNNLEKKFLVWTGKYKTVEEVPAYVAQNVVERARNRMRIKISNYMIAATAIGCVIMVFLGKKAAKRGESIVKENQEWHRKVKEDAQREKELQLQQNAATK